MKKKKRNKKECREKQTKQNFHLNVNKRPMKKENKKQPSFKERTKTDFVKRDYYHKKKNRNQIKQGLFYFNKYQP